MLTVPKYETYQDSNISWLQDIPVSWKLERAKWLFTRMERPVRREDDVVTAFRDGQVTLRKNRREEGFTNALQEHGYQGIRKGDLVIHAMDAFAGAIGVSDSDGKSTPVYSVCTPRGEFYVNNFYYAYLLRYMALSGFIQSLAKGIRERSTDFRFNDFANLCLPIPPKEEQDRIVKFLDRKTAEIDQAIAQKQRLIELLQEQKAILINQAVTKGLNQNAPMRDSTIEWIGNIPVHWKVIRNRYLFHEQNERSIDGSEVRLSMSQKLGLIPSDELVEKTLQSESNEGAKLCKKGDLILNRLKAHLGVFSVAPYGGLVSPDYSVFRMRDPKMAPEYFEHLFKTAQYISEFNKRVKGIVVGFYRLYTDSFYDIPCISPPKEEQAEIRDWLFKKHHEFKIVEESIKTEIKKLVELKAVLISNTVTGKMKV